jgi:hypothetical protein
MLERQRAAGATLPRAERALLGEHLVTLEAALEPGLGRLTWTSLTISDFVAAVNKVHPWVGVVTVGQELAAQKLGAPRAEPRTHGHWS